MRSAAGAALLVAAVEGAWQLNGRAVERLPAALRGPAAPLQLGLRVVRVCVWSAAVVMASSQLKAGCFVAADRVAGVVAGVRRVTWLGGSAAGAGGEGAGPAAAAAEPEVRAGGEAAADLLPV